MEWQGNGCLIRDVSGNEYIDCLGGYGVFALGHANPVIVEAVVEQARKLPLSTKTFLNKPLADLCELLAHLAPGDLQYTFLSNSGAEAVEAALKFARMATGRSKIVSTVGSYHGKNDGGVVGIGPRSLPKPFAPLVPGFTHIPFGDSDAFVGRGR